MQLQTCPDLLAVADALRPASLVIETERQEAEEIEFLTKKAPIKDHYEDLPLFREVPLPELREQHLAPPASGAQGRRALDAESPEDSRRTVAILTADECRLHKSGGTFEDRRVEWRQLFSDFHKVCPRAARGRDRPQHPHFVVIGAPGTGKSTFQQYVAWLAATGGEPFAHDFRLVARVSLRDWEAYCARLGGVRQLETYLAAEHPASRRSGGPTTAHWQQWLASARLILLLDGLDEIEHGGEFAKALERQLAQWPDRLPVVLTCRSLSVDAYRSALTGWPIFSPAGLSPDQRRGFIQHFPRGDTSKLVPKDLERELGKRPELAPLAENPLLLNVICFLADEGLSLPDTRDQLLHLAVDQLLARKKAVHFQRFLADERATVRPILARVAAALFRCTEGLRPATAAEYEAALEAALPQAEFSTDRHFWKRDLKAWFKERSGLVRESRSGDVTFLHNQFLEFLAGEGLASDSHFAAHVADAVQNVDRWREVLKYAAARKLASPGTEEEKRTNLQAVRDLLERLAGGPERGQSCPPGAAAGPGRTRPSALPPALPATDLGWRKVVLAGDVLRDLGPERLGPDEEAGARCLQRVRKQLAALVEHESLPENRPPNRQDRKGLSVHERAHAGEVLGWLDDPRPGVGLARDAQGKLLTVRVGGKDLAVPRFAWCGAGGEVRADEANPLQKAFPVLPVFKLGEPKDREDRAYGSFTQFNCPLITRPFFISKYLVTVAQYQAFVEAGGYEREFADDQKKHRIWTPDGWRWRTEKNVTAPEDYSPVFQTPNHPRVGVSWFEARAYAAWLNSPEIRVHLACLPGAPADQVAFRLPTEAEWELAARWKTVPLTRPADTLSPSEGERDGVRGPDERTGQDGPDDRLYPWGDEQTAADLTERCNWHQTGIGSTSAVGLFPKGCAPCGAADLAGNADEWCQTQWVKEGDKWRPGEDDKPANWIDDDDGMGIRVLRGGSWFLGDPGFLRAAYRYAYHPGDRDNRTGFRVVVLCG